MAFDGQIEALTGSHDRRNFACGEPALDDYLRRFARQHAASNLSRTYVAAAGGHIAGYYSLAMSAIRKEQLPPVHQKKFPHYPVPVARLARLAVDQPGQGSGLGQLLLMDALYRCHWLSDEIGSAGVVVDAKHAAAQRFYQKFNFETFPESPLTLWLPAAAIAALFPKGLPLRAACTNGLQAHARHKRIHQGFSGGIGGQSSSHPDAPGAAGSGSPTSPQA